jgi:hypothetical protein
MKDWMKYQGRGVLKVKKFPGIFQQILRETSLNVCKGFIFLLGNFFLKNILQESKTTSLVNGGWGGNLLNKGQIFCKTSLFC